MPLTRAQLEAPLQKLAKQLDMTLHAQCGERIGFALLVFDFNDFNDANMPHLTNGPHIAYVSNAERASMVRAMKEMVAKLETGLQTDPPGPPAEA